VQGRSDLPKAPPSADTSPEVPAPELKTLSDEALLRKLSGGESDAFDELFARHSGTLLSFISRLTVGKYDPEDLLQETFLRVLTHAQDFRPGTAIRPWLFTIARNVTLNALKKTRLRSDLEVQTDLSDWNPPAPHDGRSDPSNRAELQEQKVRMLNALQDLPPLHREILVLIMFNSFSYEEAAAITGDPESTLRSRVFHALRKLRDRLKEQH
jgi:RNA polymerase sigma-70 factor (ECF subfamily)